MTCIYRYPLLSTTDVGYCYETGTFFLIEEELFQVYQNMLQFRQKK